MRSVSARLATWSALIGALIIAMFFAGTYFWSRDMLLREVQARLKVESRLLLSRIAEEGLTEHSDLRADLKEDLLRLAESEGVEAEVEGKGGKLLFSTPGFRRARERGLEHQDRVSGDGLTVIVATNRKEVDATLRRLLLYFGLLTPLGIAVAFLLGLVVAKRLLAPIEAVRLQAERISRSSVSGRISEQDTSGELRELVRTFNAMLGRLEEAILDLENFAADAAHELRTPLATLRAEIETAVQSTQTPEEHERLLASFQVEVARMSRVVADLFLLAKVDMRQYALQKERLRIAPLLEEARETWQPLASSRKIEIATEGGDAEVLGDSAALRRVFMNLVENAVKYNRDGGRVTLSVGRVKNQVAVRVADTGIGIPAEHLPRLFQRFFRVDKARSRDLGGAGLGLAICRSFVLCHAGSISVTSTPGEGSTFTVMLPV